MRPFNKVFGIGLSRTGTHSLTAALEQLGIPTIHWPTNMKEIFEYRGATDITVSCRFRELDQIFPDSLFIYTERDQEGWLRSVVQHYEAVAKRGLKLRSGDKMFAQEADIRIYGNITPAKDSFGDSYARHHASVAEHFHDKPDRFLRINITQGEGWERLCAFFHLPVLDMPFPCRGRRNYPELSLED
jgi:hypothetical protein